MDEPTLTKLADLGWTQGKETAETTSQGEDWQWKVLKKTMKPGDTIGELRGVQWNEVVFFVVK